MKLPIFYIDAFATTQFTGNPAAVVPLPDWLPDTTMQAIATENNLSETAFFVRESSGKFHIRWFSPLKEIAFCGHATLASAYVIFKHQDATAPITFWAAAVGDLSVEKIENGLIEMSFPQRAPSPLSTVPPALLAGLSIKPQEILKNQQAYIAIYADEEDVKKVVPNLAQLATLGPLDVAVTAPGTSYDFVSRYFWPANGGEEDPVTGSIHTALAPYWAKRLNKTHLIALQASLRTGVLNCRLFNDRVFISGSCMQYLEGHIGI